MIEIVPKTFIHYPKWLERELADTLFLRLVEETSQKCQPQMTYSQHGPRFNPMKKMGRFGDPDMTYSYKGKEKQVNVWTRSLLALRELVETSLEQKSGFFNCGVVNIYGDESADLYPHTDIAYIPQLGQEPLIAAASFGATRDFILRPIDAKPKDKKDILISIEHSDLFVMQGKSQLEWKHGVAPCSEKKGMRLSVTFRRHNAVK